MDEVQRSHMFQQAVATLREAVDPLRAVYVYGSWARGDARADSDLDLAVLLAPGACIADPLALAASVAERVGREVDIVDLRRAGDLLRHEVLAEGVTVYESDPGEVLDWEVQAMGRYARHREAISELLEDFMRTGVGYGR